MREQLESELGRTATPENAEELLCGASWNNSDIDLGLPYDSRDAEDCKKDLFVRMVSDIQADKETEERTRQQAGNGGVPPLRGRVRLSWDSGTWKTKMSFDHADHDAYASLWPHQAVRRLRTCCGEVIFLKIMLY